jgi:uncharacterized protein YciI
MTRCTLLILLLVGSLVGREAAGADSPDGNGLPKSTFLVTYRPGPAWLPGKPVEEQPLQAHGSYLLDLYIQGALKFAGPFTDDRGGGVLVFEAADETTARKLLAADPAVISGLMVPDLRPWRMVDWQLHAKRRAERQAAGAGD